MLHGKFLFWAALIIAIVIGGAIVVTHCVAMKSQNQSSMRFVIDADELPSADGEHVIRYVSSDGTLSENSDESVGTIELWME